MNANLKAFLLVIRTGEGTAGPDGYRTLFGGGLFDSFKDHPKQSIARRLGGKVIRSTAAGAYQILWRTWLECKKAKGLKDFTPESQDSAAVFLIVRRGAYADIIAGRIKTAIGKCNKEWASLPGSPYGQPTLSMADALEVFANGGGVNLEQ